MKVVLDKKTHTYTTNKGEKYKSVSKLIEQFVPFFDFEQKSYDYSLKYGIPVEEVRASWREKNKKSTEYGHKIHKIIEEQIKVKDFSHKEKIYTKVLKEVQKYISIKDQIFTEEILHCDNHKIAGTSDLIIERKADFDIIDFKTNKKIKFENPYEDSFLLFPLNTIPNAEYFKYALQLSLYAYMHELKTNKKAYRLIIFWFKRKNIDDYECFDGEWVKYSLPYLKEEVELILEYGARK